MHSLGSCYLLNYLRLPVRRKQDKLLSQAVIISPSGIFCLDQPTPGATLEWIMGVPVCPASCLLPRPRRVSGGWRGPGAAGGVSGHCQWPLGLSICSGNLGQSRVVTVRGFVSPCSWKPGAGTGWTTSEQPQTTSEQASGDSITPANFQSFQTSEHGPLHWGHPAILHIAPSCSDWRENNFTFEDCSRNRMVSALILKNGSVSPTSGILK